MQQLLVTRRVQIAVVLAAVLFVPALTRTTQHLTSVSTSHESPGFSKSADAAPERVTVTPNLQALAFDLVAVVLGVQPLRAVCAATFDQTLPPLLQAPLPRPLRAPPSFVRL